MHRQTEEIIITQWGLAKVLKGVSYNYINLLFENIYMGIWGLQFVLQILNHDLGVGILIDPAHILRFNS